MFTNFTTKTQSIVEKPNMITPEVVDKLPNNATKYVDKRNQASKRK